MNIATRLGCALGMYYLYGFIILLLLTGSESQSVKFPSNTTNLLTECKDNGVIDGANRITFYGRVNTNGTNNNLYLVFEARNASVSGSFFLPDCEVDIDRDGCKAGNSNGCYCADRTGDVYTLVYNRTAEKQKSRFELQLRWQSRGIADGPANMPVVHDKEDISLTHKDQTTPEDTCSLKRTTEYFFTFCAHNLENPTLTVHLNGSAVNTSTTDCITYNLTSPNSNKSPVVFYYSEGSGCQRSGNLTCDYYDTSEEDNLGLKVGLPVALVLCTAVVVVVIVVILYKKKKCCFAKGR